MPFRVFSLFFLPFGLKLIEMAINYFSGLKSLSKQVQRLKLIHLENTKLKMDTFDSFVKNDKQPEMVCFIFISWNIFSNFEYKN